MGTDAQSLDNLVVESIDIPVEVASGLDERVVEACQLLLLQSPVVNCSDDGTSAGGAEVNGKKGLFHDGCMLKNVGNAYKDT